MRVVHISRRFAPMLGGIERYMHNMATGQARLGHDVTVVTLDRDVIGDTPSRLPSHETIDGVRVVRLPGLDNRRFVVRGGRTARFGYHPGWGFREALIPLLVRACQ
jgi:alpha-1,3-mannosyltransferase